MHVSTRQSQLAVSVASWSPSAGNPQLGFKKLDVQHKDNEQLAIHNTFPRRWPALLALETTAGLYTKMGFCIPIKETR